MGKKYQKVINGQINTNSSPSNLIPIPFFESPDHPGFFEPSYHLPKEWFAVSDPFHHTHFVVDGIIKIPKKDKKGKSISKVSFPRCSLFHMFGRLFKTSDDGFQMVKNDNEEIIITIKESDGHYYRLNCDYELVKSGTKVIAYYGKEPCYFIL
jgi:hypothetical protein